MSAQNHTHRSKLFVFLGSALGLCFIGGLLALCMIVSRYSLPFSQVGNILSSSASLNALSIGIGGRVQTNGTVNVRQTAAGSILGTQGVGSQGTVVGGPVVASLSGISYTWFNINFDSGPDGWVADIGLVEVTTAQTLSVSLTANPSSGNAPLNGVDLTATVGGTATGTINYTFYCNRPDSGTNITSGWNAKFDGITLNPKTALDACNYSAAGNYTAKVIAERGSAPPAEARLPISISTAQTLSVSLTANLSSGNAPLNGVDLTATVGGTATGTINYTFYCNRPDSGTNITSGWNAKFDGITLNPKTALDACNYSAAGNYTAKVIAERGSAPPAEARVPISVNAAQTLSVSFSATPTSGNAPLNGVDLTATVSGTATGTVNYTFYCNRSDSGTNITSGWDAKFDGISATSKTVIDECSYPAAGNYTAKVIVERGSAPPAEARVSISVTTAQTLSVSFSATPTSGNAPLNGVDLTATVSGTATGTVNYTFYCNRFDSGTNITSGWDAKFDGISATSKTTIDECSYPNAGNYTAKVIVERGSAPPAEGRVPISVTAAQTLSVSFSATPSSGNAPLNGVDLTATVGGTATGTINYTFYCNRPDSGTNITSEWNAKFDGITLNPKTALDACNYSAAGNYTAKVIAERGSAPPAEARVPITVAQEPAGSCNYQDDYPYPTQDPSKADPWHFFYRECTSYVAWKINRDANTVLAPYFFDNYMRGGHFGNAGDWATNASDIGFVVDNTPAVGAVAHWAAGELGAIGHVAYVEKVNPDGSVNLSEYNRGLDHKFGVRCNVRGIPRFIHINKGMSSANPSASQVAAQIRTLADKYNIPANILASLAWKESSWRQFDTDGKPLTGPTGDIGIMQINISNPALPFDKERVLRDWVYNMDVGCQILKSRFYVMKDSASPYDTAYDTYSSILENWYYPVAWYNGSEAKAYVHVRTIWGHIKSLPPPLSTYFQNVAIGDPIVLNSFPTTIYDKVPYPPNSLDLETATSSQLVSHGMYTLRILAQNGQKIHQWDWTTSTASDVTSMILGTPPAPQLQLLLDESGPDPSQAVAMDSVLLVRDSFPLIQERTIVGPEDRNTRVIIFSNNLKLATGETASAVTVNLVDAGGQSFDIAAEDVRLIAERGFVQVTFRLPDNVGSGQCIIRLKVHGETSNTGTLRIRF